MESDNWVTNCAVLQAYWRLGSPFATQLRYRLGLVYVGLSEGELPDYRFVWDKSCRTSSYREVPYFQASNCTCTDRLMNVGLYLGCSLVVTRRVHEHNKGLSSKALPNIRQC